jgi:Ni,Fe-hydrogenase III large subunit
MGLRPAPRRPLRPLSGVLVQGPRRQERGLLRPLPRAPPGDGGIGEDRGEAYVQIEAPRGWLGIHIVSNNTDKPYRLHIRPPSFINLQILQEILKGSKVADTIAILGSIDIVLGEVDR